MKLFVVMLMFFSFSSFAGCNCWTAEGSLGVDGETWKFNQRFENKKEYIFPMGTFILKMKVNRGEKNVHTFVYVVQEKKGITLTDITEGDEEIKEGVDREIFAKGKPGQPNSIIAIKLIHI